MHVLFTVSIIILTACTYIGTAGFIGSKFLASRKAICSGCRRGYCHSDHAGAATVVGIFWIFTIPAIAGMILGGNGTDRLSRVDRRRAQELDEARHQTELARERERAAQALDRQERALGIR